MLVDSVDKFESILISNSIDDLGKFFDKMWKIKKEIVNGISNEKIDNLYQKGIDAGALGGKVLGAGGGGFILFYVPRNSQKAFESKMINNTFLDFNFENHGSKIIFVEG
jgi:D-glycero-alpha-D-manno-heptose-7-phosphate kinase